MSVIAHYHPPILLPTYHRLQSRRDDSTVRALSPALRRGNAPVWSPKVVLDDAVRTFQQEMQEPRGQQELSRGKFDQITCPRRW